MIAGYGRSCYKSLIENGLIDKLGAQSLKSMDDGNHPVRKHLCGAQSLSRESLWETGLHFITEECALTATEYHVKNLALLCWNSSQISKSCYQIVTINVIR